MLKIFFNLITIDVFNLDRYFKFAAGNASPIQGVVSQYKAGTEFLGNDARLTIEMDDTIHDLDIEKTPLLLLLSKVGKEAVGQMKYEWMTEARPSDWIQSTAIGGSWQDANASSGTLTVASGDKWLFAVNDIVLIPAVDANTACIITIANQETGVLTMQSVDGNNLDFRQVGSTYPKILLLGNSFEEGSGIGTIKSKTVTLDYNYIQIMQTPAGVTTTLQHIDFRGGDEFARQKMKAGIEHAFKMEKTAFFGTRAIQTTGLDPNYGTYAQRFTGGILEKMSTNVTDANGALTEAEFKAWLIDATYYAKSPVIFSGDLVYEGLTTWAESILQLDSIASNKLGMSVWVYRSPYGKEVRVIPHRELFTDDFAGIAFCVDMDDIKQVYLQGLDTHLAMGVQSNGLKQQIDEFRTWFGMKVGNEKRHGYLYGVTSISTS